jgi:hypothetical protein
VFGGAVSATATSGGTVSRTPDLALYPYGSQVTVTAQANTGFEFITWSDGDTNKVRTLTVTSAYALQASFLALPQFTLSAAALGGVGGTVAAEPSQPAYYRDTPVTLIARPAPGYIFQTWLDGDVTDPRTIIMETNRTVFAVFAPGQGVGPSITSLTVTPADATVSVGDNATFSAIATGSVPLEYQWNHNGTNIAGATAASLTLTSVQASDAGTYTVNIHNSTGSTGSGAALTVVSGSRPALSPAQIANGMVSFDIVGMAGQQYEVETSTDLHAWTQAATLSNTQGRVTYSEAVAANSRFYRVSVIP